MWMVGRCTKEITEYARHIGLDENAVHFTGAVSYGQVARTMQLSQAFVLFSRYENLPCVIIEALCCGLPVISTDVGGISEIINAGNGILINSEDETKLTDAFARIYEKYKNYDRKSIAEDAANQYSYQAVGGLINSVYRNISKGN